MPKKGRKDPNKPKGVKSAYIFFTEHIKREQKDKVEQLSFTEQSKYCGKLWGELKDDDKKPFVALSSKDRERYESEMEDYSPPSASDSDSEDDSRSKRKKKKKEKDPNAPKRNMTAFFHFASEMRPKIKATKGNLAVTEVAVEVGKRWRGLSAEEKKPYDELAEKDKARYAEEMAEYLKTK